MRFATAACIFSTSELQKVVPECSEDYSFLAFSLQNVRFATAACIFSTSELQKVVPECSEDYIFLAFSLQNVRFATAACIFSTSELQKVVPECQFFNIFTSKCAFRHRVVHFFNISTYKNGPNTSCFVHFHFKMCFSPQRRAIFDLSADHLTPHPPL